MAKEIEEVDPFGNTLQDIIRLSDKSCLIENIHNWFEKCSYRKQDRTVKGEA